MNPIPWVMVRRGEAVPRRYPIPINRWNAVDAFESFRRELLGISKAHQQVETTRTCRVDLLLEGFGRLEQIDPNVSR